MLGVIGISPGNSYFTQEVVNKLLKKGLEDYPRIGVFIPDVPAISTYIALGYPENRARRDKAIPQGNAFKNKVKNAISSESLDASRIRLFDWAGENIEDNKLYREKYALIRNLYDSNVDFKKAADATTKEVLENNPFRKIEIGEKEIETGVHYLLSEFAFMLFLPGYENEDQVEYTYHKPWPAFENLISGKYTSTPIEGVSFKQYSGF